jgi:hypothetical protein
MRATLKATQFYILLILFTFLGVGCAKSAKKAEVAPGITTVPQLKASLGDPTRVWNPQSRPKAAILEYREGCSYQVEKDVVVGISCPPSGNEAVLQYWRHQWIGDNPRLEEVAGTGNIHGQKLYQLSHKRLGMSVVYDEAIGRVIRVVRYAKP